MVLKIRFQERSICHSRKETLIQTTTRKQFTPRLHKQSYFIYNLIMSCQVSNDALTESKEEEDDMVSDDVDGFRLLPMLYK